MAPRDVRDSIEQLRLNAHQTGKRDIAALYTLSLIRLDEENHAKRIKQRRSGREEA